jgi:hypothetical protein
MAKLNIGIGSTANDGTGDTLRVAGGKINDNFSEIYTALGTGSAITLTSSVAELNILDGVTSTTAELNILDGVTSTAAELNILDGATLTVTELNYVDGVTSAIQTQLDAKSPTAGSSSVTTLGTIATGVWNGTVIAGQYGGTGVANTGKTITLGGNLTTSGAHATTLTTTGTTGVTLPTTGTLATLAGAETFTNKTLTSSVLGGTTTSASGNIVVKPFTNILEVQGDGTSVVGQIQLNCHVNSHGQKIASQPHSEAATNTLKLPGGTIIGNADAVLVSDTGIQTLSNKTAGVATATSTAASVGYMGLPQSATSTTATLAIGDAGKHIYVATSLQTITIPANASVAYPIGTTIDFIAGPDVTTVTIAIASDTMYLAGTGTTGSRTLATYGMATAVKVAATTWYISGFGLT